MARNAFDPILVDDFDRGYAALFEYLRRSFVIANSSSERFHVVYLDSNHQYIDDTILATGPGHHLAVRLRELFSTALRLNAFGILVAHNHPSGDCRPSHDDLQATRRLQDIGLALGIELLDHLIFTREKVYSMRAGGKL